MVKKIFNTLLLISIYVGAHSQNFDRIDVPVLNKGKFLSLLNTGGLKSAQFSNIDFNLDGQPDLFIFDRNADQIIPLVKTGEIGSLGFRFAPEFIPMFPKLTSWALLYDFNKDGVEDIFTASNKYPACIEVWKGSRDPSGRLLFQLLKFNYGLPEILQIPASGGYTQIYVSPIDLPAISDVDSDGDMDIISFEPDGSYASWYQNLSVEENLGLDSLKFVLKDLCWGKFAENQFNEEITLSDNPFSCAAGFTSGGNIGVRHSGSTLTVFDNDGDGLMDIILGDLASSRLKRLFNKGSQQNAHMTRLELNFPSDDISVDLDVFLAAYYVDADGDRIRDLIVTPNDISSGESEKFIWLYKNTGTDKAPVFRFFKNDFLIDEMPFFNSGSHPEFADINGDGLTDLLIGTNGILKKNGVKTNRMALLINIGTADNPMYSIENEDYLNFSRFGNFTGRYAPCFGDLDNDGDLDLLVGDAVGQLYYCENIAGKGQPMVFNDPIYPYFDIFVGQNAKPQIIDLDKDGLPDIIAGKKNNQLNYIKNVGQIFKPIFSPNLSTLPNITQLGQLFSFNEIEAQNGAPYFIKEKNKQLMLFGTESADVRTYIVPENALSQKFDLLYSQTGNIRQGRKTAIALQDIDNDGYYEMVVGNDRGGISFYNTIFKYDTTTSVMIQSLPDFQIEIFPNPATGFLNIKTEQNNFFVTLHTILGEEVMALKTNEPNDISGLKEGIYFVKSVFSGKIFIRKVILTGH